MHFWDQRYKRQEYAYGTEPNVYFREALEKIPGEKILFAGEGEGRNAVYAASRGWLATAFDLSRMAKEKAEALALENNAKIEYIVADLEDIALPREHFDVLVLIFAHFDGQKRKAYHQKLVQSVKKGGWLILEAFNKCHVNRQAENPEAGGPKDPAMLYDMKELKEDFQEFDLKECYQTETELHEGLYHKGRASVVRILGQKRGSFPAENQKLTYHLSDS
ncbi:MAG: class I SAM-dependent methyltransferase [Leadbetterella sp.]|nr:class I SAM-dependent methyltransferase [Leadbetterella sp.]